MTQAADTVTTRRSLFAIPAALATAAALPVQAAPEPWDEVIRGLTHISPALAELARKARADGNRPQDICFLGAQRGAEPQLWTQRWFD